MQNKLDFDVVVIGGGVCGTVFLKYAVEKGLRCILLEKQDGVGGLWKKIPAWQGIQVRKEDWSINDVPLEGTDQKDILKNIEAWVEKYHLQQHIRLSTEVTRIVRNEGTWRVDTTRGPITCRFVVVASGLHNDPFIPKFPAVDSKIIQIHSAQLHDPKVIAGKRVAVVGGGASAFDLLDLSFQQNASEVHLLYRHTRWMGPSLKPKDSSPALRRLAYNQWRQPIIKLTPEIQAILDDRYAQFQMEALKPTRPFSYLTDALLPGRPLMAANYSKIIRHHGEIQRIEGNKITIGPSNIEVDYLLLGTGYNLNLKFLGLPHLASMTTREELMRRCGTLILSLDYPDLFFVGAPILDVNGIAPLGSAILAKTTVAHMLGKTVIPRNVHVENVNHWDLIRLMAGFDRYNYTPLWWRLKYRYLSWWYLKNINRSIHF